MEQPTYEIPSLPYKKIVAVLIIVGIAISVVSASVGGCEAGHASVIIDPLTGRISGPVVGPKWFLKAPWQYDKDAYIAVDKVDLWTDPNTGQTGDLPTVSCLTKDGLTADVDISIRWTVNPKELVDLYRNYPTLDWKERTITPTARRIIRDVIVEYTAIETINRRTEVSGSIREALLTVLPSIKSLAGSILIESVDTRRIGLPPTFKEAIEAKLRTEQLMIAAEFNKTRIMVMANATAQRAVIEAEGRAKARIIEANATRESMEIIAEMAGSDSIRLKEAYLTLSLLKEIAATGRNVYIITSSGEIPLIISPESKD